MTSLPLVDPLPRKDLKPERRLSFRPEDPVLSDPSWSGELLAAKVRIIVVVLLLGIRLATWEHAIQIVGVIANIFGLVYASGWWLLIRRAFRPWMGYASAFIDVTIVSAMLAGLVLAGHADAAINTRLVYDIYLLAIGVSSLRFNWRVSAFTTLLALAQFGALQAWVIARGEMGFQSPQYGMANPSVQVGRALIIGIAGVLSIAMVRRTQELLRLSSTDWLTGLSNRGVFDSRLHALVRKGAPSHKDVFSIALLDLDHFKRFNDTHGHATGDEVLRAVALTAAAKVREGDTFARVGGEEFGVIFKGASVGVAAARLEELRRVVELLDVSTPEGPERVSISIGVAEFPADGTTDAELVDAADRRLYEAKALGRNRVVAGA